MKINIISPPAPILIQSHQLKAGTVVQIYDKRNIPVCADRDDRYLVTLTNGSLQLHSMQCGNRWCLIKQMDSYLYRTCAVSLNSD